MRGLLSTHSRNFDAKTSGIGEWDVDYASGIQRQAIYSKLGRIADYFHFDSILSGFETLVSSLYGLKFSRMFPDAGEIWPGNVLKLVVIPLFLYVCNDDEIFQKVYKEEGNIFLGTIFLDLDSRPSKVQGDCHFTIRCSKLVSGRGAESSQA